MPESPAGDGLTAACGSICRRNTVDRSRSCGGERALLQEITSLHLGTSVGILRRSDGTLSCACRNAFPRTAKHLRRGENGEGWMTYGLEMFEKGSESVEFEEALPGGRGIDHFMFKHPGVGMMHQHCVQAGGERGIDIGARTVADHPRALAR